MLKNNRNQSKTDSEKKNRRSIFAIRVGELQTITGGQPVLVETMPEPQP